MKIMSAKWLAVILLIAATLHVLPFKSTFADVPPDPEVTIPYDNHKCIGSSRDCDDQFAPCTFLEFGSDCTRCDDGSQGTPGIYCASSPGDVCEYTHTTACGTKKIGTCRWYRTTPQWLLYCVTTSTAGSCDAFNCQ